MASCGSLGGSFDSVAPSPPHTVRPWPIRSAGGYKRVGRRAPNCYCGQSSCGRGSRARIACNAQPFLHPICVQCNIWTEGHAGRDEHGAWTMELSVSLSSRVVDNRWRTWVPIFLFRIPPAAGSAHASTHPVLQVYGFAWYQSCPQGKATFFKLRKNCHTVKCEMASSPRFSPQELEDVATSVHL